LPCSIYGCGSHPGGSSFFRKLFLMTIFCKLGLRSGLFWEKGGERGGGGDGRGQIYLILWLGEII